MFYINCGLNTNSITLKTVNLEAGLSYKEQQAADVELFDQSSMDSVSNTESPRQLRPKMSRVADKNSYSKSSMKEMTWHSKKSQPFLLGMWYNTLVGKQVR